MPRNPTFGAGDQEALWRQAIERRVADLERIQQPSIEDLVTAALQEARTWARSFSADDDDVTWGGMTDVLTLNVSPVPDWVESLSVAAVGTLYSQLLAGGEVSTTLLAQIRIGGQNAGVLATGTFGSALVDTLHRVDAALTVHGVRTVTDPASTLQVALRGTNIQQEAPSDAAAALTVIAVGTAS